MIHTFRVFLYFLLLIFSIVVLSLSAVRIHYTTHLSPSDPLNGGVHFYDHVVAELLATSIITVLWSLFVLKTIHGRHEHRVYHSFTAELIGLFILFILWLVGAAVATHSSNPPDVDVMWGNLSSCWRYSTCRILTALLAFVWLSWLMVLALFVISFLYAIAHKGFGEPMHGRWDRRATTYSMRNLPK